MSVGPLATGSAEAGCKVFSRPVADGSWDLKTPIFQKVYKSQTAVKMLNSMFRMYAFL